MVAQLDLLSYQPTPDELREPPPKPPEINRHALAWWECKQLFYLRKMNTFILSNHPHKTHEIKRLHTLREQALQTIELIKGGNYAG